MMQCTVNAVAFIKDRRTYTAMVHVAQIRLADMYYITILVPRSRSSRIGI
jgi:hypothetical protein